ncbi:Tubulin polyglutamylase ttll6, partial [Irineochytrium annulatum]
MATTTKPPEEELVPWETSLVNAKAQWRDTLVRAHSAGDGAPKPTAAAAAAAKTSRKARAKKAKTVVTINTKLCKYDIVRACSKQCGFKVVDEMESWCLFWIDTGVAVQRVLEMEPYQKINHFPGMHEICRKDALARNLSRLSRLLPKDYNFFPKTWTLPSDWEDLRLSIKSRRRQTFIAKPDHGCQGKGIFLFRSLKAIAPHRSDGDMIVQSYIPRPFLIDHLKFDLRVYVLVTSVDPLRVFIHRDGLARFATQKYADPSEANIADTCMHLTNYAINKHSSNFVKAESEDAGSKRTIASVLKWIEEKGKCPAAKMWRRIEEVVIKTILTTQPQLSMILKACFRSTIRSKTTKDPLTGEPVQTYPPQGPPSQCFEILGFDIFLDSKLKPWVLEVNHSPSFTCDSELDVKVKEAVIGDTLRLLDLRHANRTKFMKEERERIRNRLFGGVAASNAAGKDGKAAATKETSGGKSQPSKVGAPAAADPPLSDGEDAESSGSSG